MKIIAEPVEAVTKYRKAVPPNVARGTMGRFFANGLRTTLLGLGFGMPLSILTLMALMKEFEGR